MNYPPVDVKVWGPQACFTNPLQKLERVTYEVMTPSAARGMLEAIFAHPPYMHYRVREIAVLNEIKHFSILRNEVTQRMSLRADSLSIADERSQKHTLGLRDVAYIIKADILVTPGATDREGALIDVAKYRDQFRRRVERGQCFYQPAFGCREFVAFFGPTDGERPIELSASLGRMLFDIEYTSSSQPKKAHFFDAELVDGRLVVPQHLYDVARPIGGDR